VQTGNCNYDNFWLHGQPLSAVLVTVSGSSLARLSCAYFMPASGSCQFSGNKKTLALILFIEFE